MGKQRPNLTVLEDVGELGDWCFNFSRADIFIRYPSTAVDPVRGDIIHLPICEGNSIASPVRWGWNGSEDAPTITPSILVNGGDGQGGRKQIWHGWLTAGKLIEA